MVMMPAPMPTLSCSTLATGARQLVVQEALEITREAALEHLVVDAVDDGGIDVLAARRRDHHLLRAALEVRAGLGLAGEEPGALEHEFGAELAPGELGRIALGEHADAVAVDDHVVAIDLTSPWNLPCAVS